MASYDIEISEVGPRDGLQIIKDFMPTRAKKAWITAEALAGVPEIEVCSMVPPKVVPQFTDAEEIIAHALTIEGLAVAVLVPNFKGAERSVAAGAHKITLTVSVSESHSLANVRKTPDEQVGEARKIADMCANLPKEGRPGFSAGLSTVFGCTMEGAVKDSEICRLASALVEAGADDVSLADTVGYANPAQVRRIFRLVRAEIGDRLSGAHLHNTRGLGLANACAALDEGVTTLDSSLAGLGGCPFAPGASGNLVTEDLVFMLEAMGLRTGIDLEALMKVRDIIAEGLPNQELFGLIPLAGVPKGFVQAS
jgi:hydroxymethylglutaryl-CoA lyase